MHRFAGMLFLVILFVGAKAQPYGNEWIDYSRTYYKIPLTGEGIYRISYQALLQGGFPVNSYDPQNIQIFIKGREWPIYIYGEGDHIFHPSDYIEFYAPPSDGWLDSLMFSPSSSISNPYYSMYNDTLYAFITANYSLNNLRATYETDVNFSAYSSFLSPWCITKLIWQNPLIYYAGVSDPQYAAGEGWFDSESCQLGAPVTKPLNTPGFAGTVYPVSLEYSIAGASNGSSSFNDNHHLKVSVEGQALSDTMFSGYNTVKSILPINFALPATTDVRAESVDDLNASADGMTICYLALTYPRSYSFSSLSKAMFTVPTTGGTKTLLNISGMTSSNVVLWDITNSRKILCQASSGIDYALLPDNGQNRQCYISTVDSIKNAVINGSFQPVDYSSTASNSDYYIITHPSLTASASQYKIHRDFTGYNTAVIDIEQLYCQFAYGIYKHPLSIRSFIRYALDTFPVKPEYLFLLGKSIHAGRWSYSECFRKDAVNYSRCLVPSWGSPSSDNMLVAGINGPAYEMPLAVGRLAATSDNDVMAYLNKVSELEFQQTVVSPQSKMWMKNILHFSGGQTAWEQSLFASYLDSYRIVVEDTLFGGQVTTIYKTSSIPVQITISDSIRNIINGGCSMMNFFGHGSSSGFDQSIEDPSDYYNTGKYPLLIANSCLTGDIHLPPPLRLSETWVLTPSKGAIAFLANVDLGYSDRLNVFTSEFIKQFTYKKYGTGLGKQVQSTINQIASDTTLSQKIVNTALDFTLHGDPAVVLNSFPLSDLMVDNSSVYFSPNPVTTAEDTFIVNVIVYNQGMAISDTFLVELTRTFPDGNTAMFYKTMYGCVNRDTVAFHLSSDVVYGAGPNHFCVRADPEDSIAEINELNNQVCIDIIIQSGDLIPVHPYEYAIYPASTVKLKASSAYAFAGPQQCVFQIDTDDEFEPTHLTEAQFTYPGGVAEWQPPFALQDCTVYYWRVSIVGDTLNWKESSFIYISGKTGWSQAHYFQFKKDGYRFIDYVRDSLDWYFTTSPHLLKCHTMGSSAITSYLDYKYSIDGTLDVSSCGAANAILVVVIDPVTLEPWKSGRFSIGFGGHGNDPHCSNRTRDDLYFVFYANSTYLPALENFIRNIIPDGHFILIYTFINGMFQTWDTSLYEVFESLGDTTVRNLPNDHPYVFFCKKGDPSTAEVRAGQSSFSVIDFEQEILTDNDYGYMTSTLIGPSANWGSLHWRYLADNADETARLKVTGITLGGDTQVIFPSLSRDTLDIYNLEQYVQASTHPYMEMNLYTKDDSLKTPVWMQRWQVTYDGVPETAINPSKGYIPPKDILDEGDTLIFGVATENISEYYMDSLLVRYWLTDRNNQIVPLDIRRLRPHPGSHVLMDSIHFSTEGYPGFNSIWYEVNTTNSATGHYDQLEQYHFNNYAQKTFYVRSDLMNPLLDVTFDGVRILNGDIVSAKPLIVVGLKDENKFIAPVTVNDTVVFQVYIKNLQTGIENRVYFGNQSIMKFIPATLPKNSCKIEYSPSFPEDGKYQLRVQAKDLSGNESGDYDYTIQFEVINKSTITNIFNYPNPFSTSTRFVFTLTGSELPEDMRIQIITVTGKVVREINQAELGPLHVGNNVTEFAWDGTDMYGDKLANGVYFYRVIAKLDGGSIEHRETDADNLFHKGFGKMYIIR